MGEVEYLINSNSKVTTAQIIKGFRKKIRFLSPSSIQQKIIPEPKFKYQIQLKQATPSTIDSSYHQHYVRKKIRQQLNSSHVIFNKDSIEIWSNQEIDLSKLKDNTLLQLNDKSTYGGGLDSAKRIENNVIK